jgi:hypothetical protein
MWVDGEEFLVSLICLILYTNIVVTYFALSLLLPLSVISKLN